MRSLSLSLFLWLTAATLTPASTVITQTYNVSALIPDNNDVGFADIRTISAPELTEIVDVNVGLVFSGGWNGDLCAYLVHDSGFSVLLNRVGRTGSEPDGSASSGMNIILDDEAAGDVHVSFADTGYVTGTYQPDARTADPLVVLDSSPRAAFLSSFTGLDPNGTWTLFVADQSAGETSTLQSWSLTITAIPEPSVAVLGLLGAGLMMRRRRCSER
jgi:subtilisin-like proprotein convertase family protein